MRYPPSLNKEQIEFLMSHNEMGNKEIAKYLSVKPEIIASYRSRARKAGLDIPKFTGKSIIEQMKDALETI